MTIDDIKLVFDDEGGVTIEGAKRVTSIFPVGNRRRGKFRVEIECPDRSMFDLDIVLTGDNQSPLKMALPQALMVELGPTRVWAQDGIGSWKNRHQLFPPPKKPKKK